MVSEEYGPFWKTLSQAAEAKSSGVDMVVGVGLSLREMCRCWLNGGWKRWVEELGQRENDAGKNEHVLENVR